VSKTIHVWEPGDPCAFDFTQLVNRGWEVEQGRKLQFHVTEARMLVGNHILGPNEAWREMSRNFRGLLVYNLDTDVDLNDETVSNMVRADAVTVPSEDIRLKVLKVTEMPRDQVLVVPESKAEQIAFWDKLADRKPW